jgi:hypothetical protein
MKICKPLFILFFVVICGCHDQLYTAGSGDVAPFILKTAKRFGGLPTTTNESPRVSDQWRYYAKRNKVSIVLSAQMYSAVEAFLKQSFGPEAGSAPLFDEWKFLTNGGKLYLFGNQVTEVRIEVPEQMSNFDLADRHLLILRPMLQKDLRFSRLRVFTFSGENGSLMIEGDLFSESDLHDLKQLVNSSKPPVKVLYSDTIVISPEERKMIGMTNDEVVPK